MITQDSSRARACCSGLLFVLLLLLLSHVNLVAQTRTPASGSPGPTPSPTPTLERRFFKNILRDQKAIWTYPFRLKGEDARWLVPFGVSTAVLIGTDRRTAEEIRESDSLLTAS